MVERVRQVATQTRARAVKVQEAENQIITHLEVCDERPTDSAPLVDSSPTVGQLWQSPLPSGERRQLVNYRLRLRAPQGLFYRGCVESVRKLGAHALAQ
jgi:hypothetical protein